MGGRVRTPGEPGAPPLPPAPQALLWEAHKAELQRQREAEKLERQLALPPTEQAATQVSPPRPPFPPPSPPPLAPPPSLPTRPPSPGVCL